MGRGCFRVDPAAYPDYTIFRVLEYGDSGAFAWLQATFPEEEIRRVLRLERRLSPKSRLRPSATPHDPMNDDSCGRIWHPDTITAPAKDVLRALHPLVLAERAYLAGRTGLAIRFGHRRSVDLDFFIRETFAEEQLLQSPVVER